jgi:hypothetical protein
MGHLMEALFRPEKTPRACLLEQCAESAQDFFCLLIANEAEMPVMQGLPHCCHTSVR